MAVVKVWAPLNNERKRASCRMPERFRRVRHRMLLRRVLHSSAGKTTQGDCSGIGIKRSFVSQTHGGGMTKQPHHQQGAESMSGGNSGRRAAGEPRQQNVASVSKKAQMVNKKSGSKPQTKAA
jgi:hypothetical protein